MPPCGPPPEWGTRVFISEKWVCFVVLRRRIWDGVLNAIVKGCARYCSSSYSWGGWSLWQGRVAKEKLAQLQSLAHLSLEEDREQEIPPPFVSCSITELLRLSTQTVVCRDHNTVGGRCLWASLGIRSWVPTVPDEMEWSTWGKQGILKQRIPVRGLNSWKSISRPSSSSLSILCPLMISPTS